MGSGQLTKPRNAPARVSLWSVVAAAFLFAFARPLRPLLPDDRYFSPSILIPVCGLTSIAAGAIGLTRIRTTGVGKVQAITGLIIGIGIILLSIAVILFIWEWSRTPIPF